MTEHELSLDDLGRLGPQVRREAGFVVHDLPDLSLPDVAGPLVLRTYSAARGVPAGVRGMVGLRATLPATTRDRLDRTMTWPVRTVTERGTLRAVVQRRTPDEFRQNLTLPSGRVERVRREAQYLFVVPARVAALGLPAMTDDMRTGVCLALAAAVEFAHDTPVEIVLGDIDARSVLYDPTGEPTVLVGDCDGVRLRDSVAVARTVTAPDWEPPGEGGVPTRSTDLYRLGLFVLRCLSPGPFGSVVTDPDVAAGALDATGTALLRRALAGTGTERPAAREWRAYFSHRLGRAVSPPRLTEVSLDRTIVAAGEPVTVRWHAEEATSVEVSGAGVQDASADGWPASGSFEVRPSRTGRLRVTARNELGAAEQHTGPVAVVDVPPMGRLPVPVPDVPWPLIHTEAPPLPIIAPPLSLAGWSAGGDAAAFWPPPDPPPTTPPGPLTGVSAFPLDLTALFHTGATATAAIPSPREAPREGEPT